MWRPDRVHGKLLPDDGLEAFGKTVQTGVFPIGIDVEGFIAAAQLGPGRPDL